MKWTTISCYMILTKAHAAILSLRRVLLPESEPTKARHIAGLFRVPIRRTINLNRKEPKLWP